MADNWKIGFLACAFAAVAVGATVWTAHSLSQTAQAAVEKAGYSQASVSARMTKIGAGCDPWSERYAYSFKAKAKDGAPVSGNVCISTGLHRTARVVPDKPAP
jgi:hypothetical protein